MFRSRCSPATPVSRTAVQCGCADPDRPARRPARADSCRSDPTNPDQRHPSRTSTLPQHGSHLADERLAARPRPISRSSSTRRSPGACARPRAPGRRSVPLPSPAAPSRGRRGCGQSRPGGQMPTVCSKSSSVSPGKPAIRSVVTVRPGIRARAAATSASKSATRLRRAIRRSTASLPDWAGRCRCGIRRPPAVGHRSKKPGARSNGSSDDSRSRGMVVSASSAPTSVAQICAQIATVAAQMHAGQHGLLVALGVQRVAPRPRPRRSAGCVRRPAPRSRCRRCSGCGSRPGP